VILDWVRVQHMRTKPYFGHNQHDSPKIVDFSRLYSPMKYPKWQNHDKVLDLRGSTQVEVNGCCRSPFVSFPYGVECLDMRRLVLLSNEAKSTSQSMV
jgi:hypothetical protein